MGFFADRRTKRGGVAIDLPESTKRHSLMLLGNPEGLVDLGLKLKAEVLDRIQAAPNTIDPCQL